MGYEKLYRLPEDQYAKGAPILIKAGALLKKSDNGMILAQLKLQNISPKPVSFVKVSVFCKDAAGRDLETVEFEYLDLNAERDAMFGTQTPIRLGNRATREYTLQITEVGFVDKSVWQGKDAEWKPLGTQAPISSVISDGNALCVYQSAFGTGAAFLGQEHPELGAWRCTCGRLNADTDARCYGCGAALSEILHPDTETLRREGIYQKALALIKQDQVGTLQRAISLLEPMQDYRDSAERIQTCWQGIYQKALALIKQDQVGTLRRAISLLETMPDYQDSAERIQNCWQRIYQKALALIEEDQVESLRSAISLLETMQDYQDSAEKIQTCRQRIEALTAASKKKKKLAIIISAISAAVAVPLIVLAILFAPYLSGDYRKHIERFGITEFEIPDGVTSIEQGAFEGCTGLTSITIPDSVTSIGYGAFLGCTGLESITIPFVGATKDGNNETHFGYIFGGNASWSKDCIPSALKTVIITGGTGIGNYAFDNCSGLTSITIPDSVESVGNYAFYNCSGLTSITIPDSVTSIGQKAFSDCKSLTSITIPKGTTSIEWCTFYYCSGLTSITIPDSVTSIGDEAFFYCTALETIVYEGTVNQWTQISKGNDYLSDTPSTLRVVCTDGIVEP